MCIKTTTELLQALAVNLSDRWTFESQYEKGIDRYIIKILLSLRTILRSVETNEAEVSVSSGEQYANSFRSRAVLQGSVFFHDFSQPQPVT